MANGGAVRSEKRVRQKALSQLRLTLAVNHKAMIGGSLSIEKNVFCCSLFSFLHAFFSI